MTVNERTRPAGGSAERAETRKGSRAGVVSHSHFTHRRPRRQAHSDVFREAREAVTARRAAEFYGFSPNRTGFIRCPFHAGDQTPSLKLYADGGWFCFGCGKGGSSIGFVAQLFNLTPLEAVRKMNEDFSLGLPLDKPLTSQEQRKARREADRRDGISELYKFFEDWRTSTINELNRCVYLGNLVERYMGDPRELSDLAALALRKREIAEHLADTLSFGTPEEQIQVWAEREEVERWTNRISRDF